MLRILVATDGSPNALRALEHVVELSRRGIVIEAVVCNVQPPIMSGEVGVIAPARITERVHSAAASSALATARMMLEAAGVAATCVEATGDAGAEILAAAASHACDAIVIGRRGMGRIAGFAGESVSARVVRASPIPVTVVS